MDKSNKIEIHRGDTYTFPFFLDCGTKLQPVRYVLQPNDRLYMSIYLPGHDFEQGIIKKTYTAKDTDANGDIVIRFEHDETLTLKNGQYYYQVKLVMKKFDELGNELTPTVFTVIPESSIYIY